MQANGLRSNYLILTAMQKMALAKEANRAEADKEIHKYCDLTDHFNGVHPHQDCSHINITSCDIKNMLLHMADFCYIHEEFSKLHCIQMLKDRDANA